MVEQIIFVCPNMSFNIEFCIIHFDIAKILPLPSQKKKLRRELLPKTLVIWQKWLAFFRWPKGTQNKTFLVNVIHVAKVWCQWLIYLFTYLLIASTDSARAWNSELFSTPLIPPRLPLMCHAVHKIIQKLCSVVAD